MKWGLKNKKNKTNNFSFRKLINSFKYSINGILEVYEKDLKIIISTIFEILIIILSIYLKVSSIEFCVLLIVIGLVISFQIINASIKQTINMTITTIHPIAKMAKDASSGASLIIFLMSLFVEIVILLPKLLKLFFN